MTLDQVYQRIEKNLPDDFDWLVTTSKGHKDSKGKYFANIFILNADISCKAYADDPATALMLAYQDVLIGLGAT